MKKHKKIIKNLLSKVRCEAIINKGFVSYQCKFRASILHKNHAYCGTHNPKVSRKEKAERCLAWRNPKCAS